MGDLFCLSNFIDYSLVIHQPLKHSNRIKYTCFDISENFIIFGATSGSLYLFNRQGKFLHLIPNKHGTLTHLAISSNEKYVAFSTQRSMICVYAVNLSPQTVPQVIVTNLSSEQNVHVTCIKWTQEEKQFYYGDSKGQVNLVLLSSFIGHSLLNMTVHPILFLESPIVQIDDFESLLLISNYSKCILCNTEYEEYKQIGNRPRDGLYGACFFISQNENVQPSRIYCARPGTRFWEVDFEGEVIQTHQFKAALAIPPSKIQRPDGSYHQNNDAEANNLSDNDANSEVLNWQPQNLQFSKLQKLTQDFLLAFTELGLYIFDVSSSSVVLWCNQFERIVDVKVLEDEIIVFTQTGSLFSVQLTSLQGYACNLVHHDRLLDCASLMRQNLKYFADKAREDYSLNILNHIKNFLINRHEYELLNDLSVVFDAIAQCESNGSDNNSSSGASTGTAERSSSLGASGGFHFNSNIHHQNRQQQNCFYISKNSTPSPTYPLTVAQNQQQFPAPHSKGVYVLENAFCDNLKAQQQQQQRSSGEKHFKDALLTVTGKFGKNIIKYKFNIFAEDQQKLVRELIPVNERSMPFKDIKAFYEHGDNCSMEDEEIVCRGTPKKQSSLKGNSFLPSVPHITAEEKTIYNLYLICKSAKFSNSNFVERYRPVFDEYSANELISLLCKLEKVMIEHGDEEIQAKRNCYEMYFHYLNPELIWEVDNDTRDYIKSGFMLLNNSEDIIRCENCSFPIKFDNSCQFHELGSILLRYYWSRNEQIQCFDVLNAVPALLDILAKLYMSEHNLNKVLPIVMNFGQPELLMEVGKSFDVNSWAKAFEQFVDLIQGRAICVNCECSTCLEQVNTHFFYSWNCFLNIAFEYLKTEEILALLFKWSSYIPNDAVDRDFFTRCLLEN